MRERERQGKREGERESERDRERERERERGEREREKGLKSNWHGEIDGHPQTTQVVSLMELWAWRVGNMYEVR